MALEAGGLLTRMELEEASDLAMRTDEAIYSIISDHPEPLENSRHALDIALERAAEMNRREAVGPLVELIDSNDRMKRTYGLLLAARLHSKISSGEKWDAVVEALRRLINRSHPQTQIHARTILAACVENKAEAVGHLT